MLLCSPDVGVLSDVCWTLSFLTDDSNEKRSIVLDVSSSLSPSIIEKLVEYLDHDDIQNPALRAIGNLLAGEERHTQAVLDDPRVLPCFKKLLSHERQREVKETCYALSNISAGNPQQLQSLIQANFFPIILQMYYTVGVDDIKSEIGFIFSNATTGGVEQVEYLMENMPMFEIFLEFLEGENEGSIEGCLEGIENILKVLFFVFCFLFFVFGFLFFIFVFVFVDFDFFVAHSLPFLLIFLFFSFLFLFFPFSFLFLLFSFLFLLVYFSIRPGRTMLILETPTLMWLF